MIGIHTVRRPSLLAIALACACCAGAQERAPAVNAKPIDDQYRTSWTVRDGVPGGVWQAKQTADGFLWMASETGLYRFDGISFRKYEPPAGQRLLKDGPISALTPAANGGLWIAYRFGGMSLIRKGAVTNYPATRDAAQTVFVLAEDKDGFLWGATSTGLVRFDGHTWSHVGESWGVRIRKVDHLRLAANGDLWLDDGTAFYVLPRGANRFERTGLPNGKIDLVNDRVGWLSRDEDGLYQILRSDDGTWKMSERLLKENISSIIHTPDGSLWFGAHDGLWRIRGAADGKVVEQFDAAAIQSVRRSDGLTGDFVYALTVDREGSLWDLTPNGLDQMRRNVLTSVALPPEMERLFLVGEEESVLVGSAFHSESMIVRVSARGTQTIPSPTHTIHEIYRDSTGTVWLNGDGKLWKMSGNTFVSVAIPTTPQSGIFKIRAITLDHAGVLWVSTMADGPDQIYRLRDGHWEAFTALDEKARQSVTCMMTDRSGRVWMGTGASQVHLLNEEKVQTFGPQQGVDSGAITLLKEQGDHVWIGGTANLDYFAHGIFKRISHTDGSPIAGVTGIAESGDGDVWLNSTRGVMRITAAALRDGLLKDSPRVEVRDFNYLDGSLESSLVRLQATTVAPTRDGRIYFLGRQGLTWVDPSRLESNRIPPDVFVTSITVDQQTYQSPSTLDLTEGAENVQINYTATSLAIPARVQFRYKLENFDSGWQEAGTRRQAFYTHLPPGHYRFLLSASNNDGVWSPSPAEVGLTLPPTFLQTVWFKLLCLLALTVLLTALYLFRVNMLTAKIKSSLLERVAERERIARDLHDTFFQGIQGLFLRFNTATAMLPQDAPAKKILLEALEQSDRVMEEGRELVLDLRADDVESSDLAEQLAHGHDRASGPNAPSFKVVTVGQVRHLHPVCGSELLRIGREAVYNAFRHADAAHVEVELLYERASLKMRIRDDGKGIDDLVIREGRRPGHMGLIGMSERAERIGARYRLWSKKDQGTEIEVEVPAGVAYLEVKMGNTQRHAGYRASAKNGVHNV